MRYLPALLVCASAFAATSKVPVGCSSRPCEYTITCGAATCTGAEVAEVQTAINDAQRGDTIKLQAGKTFPTGSGMGWTIPAKTGTSGYLTITTSEDALLPSGMTRITPHWVGLLPRIYGNTSIWVECKPPANHVRIRGLLFEGVDSAAQNIVVGCTPGGLLGRVAASDADTPDDILVEHVIMRNTAWLNRKQSTYIYVGARETTIRNSWIAGGRWPGVEVQAISVINGPGPVNVFNNAIMDTGGETIMHGGAGASYFSPSPNGAIVLNASYNHPERMMGMGRGGSWSAGYPVFKGRMLREGGSHWQAQNSGTTSGSEPAWSGSTVNDNGITWLNVESDTVTPIETMNLYESKNSSQTTIAWNQFRGYIPASNQYNQTAYGLSAYTASTNQGQRASYHTGTVCTNGPWVWSDDGNPLPKSQFPVGTFGPYPVRQFTIGGTAYTAAGSAGYLPYDGDTWPSFIPYSSSVGTNSDYVLQLTTSVP